MELYAAVPDTLNPPGAGRNAATLRVCGVFSSAVYMELSTGPVYLLHSGEYGLLPFGFGVKDIRSALARLNPSAGDAVQWTSGRLAFPGGSSIFLNKTAMPELERGRACKVSGSALQRAVQLLRDSGRGAVSELVTQESGCSGSRWESVFAQMARCPLQGLLRGLREDSAPEIERALNRLIGLGPGLTPSMDDFLTGVFCTLYYAKRRWGTVLPSTGSLAKAAGEIAPKRTGKYSQAYLLAAARGQRFQMIEQVLSAFSQDAVGRLLAVGGHSGADMLTGILWAVKCVVKNC